MYAPNCPPECISTPNAMKTVAGGVGKSEHRRIGGGEEERERERERVREKERKK